MSSQPEPPEPPPRTRTGEIIREATGAGKFFANLTAGQFQAFALAFLTCFVSALTGFVVWQSQTTALAREAQMLRYTESRDEVMRQHCDAREAKLQQWFAGWKDSVTRDHAAEREKDRRFFADQLEKQRAATQGFTGEYAKWRDLLAPLLKKGGLEDEGGAAAPAPHAARESSRPAGVAGPTTPAPGP